MLRWIGWRYSKNSRSLPKVFDDVDKELAGKYIDGTFKLVDESNLRYLLDNNLVRMDLYAGLEG